MIIAISGKIGSGKDTVGKIIQWLSSQDGEVLLNGEHFGINTIEDCIDFIKSNDTLNYPEETNWQVKKFAYKLKEIVALLTGCTVEDLESQEFKNKELGKEWEYVVYYNDNLTHKMGVDFYKNDVVFEANPERFIKKYTYRELLQKIGTDAMRDKIHNNIWVNALFADYKNITLQDKIDYFKSKGINDFDFLKKTNIKLYKQIKEDFFKITRPLTSNWIITDTRFPNELKAIKDRGGISIRVNRVSKSMLYEVDQKEMTLKPFNEHPSETALDNAKFDYVIDNNGTIDELIEKVKQILILEKII